MSGKLDLGPNEWIGYCNCTVEEAVRLFCAKYGKREVEVVENCVILIRPKIGPKESDANLE